MHRLSLFIRGGTYRGLAAYPFYYCVNLTTVCDEREIAQTRTECWCLKRPFSDEGFPAKQLGRPWTQITKRDFRPQSCCLGLWDIILYKTFFSRADRCFQMDVFLHTTLRGWETPISADILLHPCPASQPTSPGIVFPKPHPVDSQGAQTMARPDIVRSSPNEKFNDFGRCPNMLRWAYISIT